MNDDFDPLECVEIREIIFQPHRFAEIWCEAASTQKSIEDAIQSQILELLKTNVEAREAIKEIIRQIEMQEVRFFWRKVGVLILSGISAIVGSVITILIEKSIH